MDVEAKVIEIIAEQAVLDVSDVSLESTLIVLGSIALVCGEYFCHRRGI